MAIILLCIILSNKNNTEKIEEKILAEAEAELIELDVEVKKETTESYNCLLTLPSEILQKAGYVLWGWGTKNNCEEAEYDIGGIYTNVNNEDNIKLYAVWDNQDNGIIRYIANNNVNTSGIYTTSALGQKYNFEVKYIDQNSIQEISGASYDQSTNTYIINDLEIGTAEGIEINGKYEQAMAVLKCDGNLTINGTITTSTYTETSPYGVTGNVTKIKGLFIYCSGILTNNGTITQTGKGTYNTKGENIYLWSKDSSYNNYIIPKDGAKGGDAIGVRNSAAHGLNGIDGIDRQTGGGGSGAAYSSSSSNGAYSGSGSYGTSYSGGGAGGRSSR